LGLVLLSVQALSEDAHPSAEGLEIQSHEAGP
jgi:hypothetical protein